MDSVKVSVIIPIYNVEPYVLECLQSVAEQTLKDIEILCIDDRGSDSSMALVEQFARQEPRLRILRHDHNQGVSVARNTALLHAQGEYISFVDPDDWVKPEFLERLYSTAVEQQTSAVLCSAAAFYDRGFSGEKDPNELAAANNVYSIKKEGMSAALSSTSLDPQRACGSVCRKLYRRSSITEIGLSFSAGLIHQDNEFNFKLACIFPMQYAIPDELYMRRIRDNSAIQNIKSNKGHYRDLCVISENCYQFLLDYNKFPELKMTLLLFLKAIFSIYLYNPKFKRVALQAIRELLQKIHFPDEYSEIRESDIFVFFDFIRKHNSAGSLYRIFKPLLLLNRLNPHSGLRRKWRSCLQTGILLGKD